ncbi:hypothetical protein [Mitsuaria sp. 7]|uniref:hypothetical protein n=1 Tax=Mitsuaria sp. 7 TaxID=1658665 RepID=UPI0018D3459A|nr:hypothetical protein [Mitsuaria sp. 7]
MDGFVIETVGPGTPGRVMTAGALTSDEPLFHRFVEGLEPAVRQILLNAGSGLSLRHTDVALLVFKPGERAEFWFDAAAVTLRCTVKRPVEMATVVFEHDISDVTGMDFPMVEIGPADKVLCLFREGWGFGLAFDFNASGNLDREAFVKALGRLHRVLRYRAQYGAVTNSTVFNALVGAGWFPFVEIIHREFKELAALVEAQVDLTATEAGMVKAFSGDRVDHMLQRWLEKPHFQAKADLLKEAVSQFQAGKPIPVIKIILTEIEGVLQDAYRAANPGQGARQKELLRFAVASAEARAGDSDTLLFPTAFGEYLNGHTFANFDPTAQNGTAGSRHAVGHGAAAQETYTMTRALQAILTLDQLAFYT